LLPIPPAADDSVTAAVAAAGDERGRLQTDMLPLLYLLLLLPLALMLLLLLLLVEVDGFDVPEAQ